MVAFIEYALKGKKIGFEKVIARSSDATGVRSAATATFMATALSLFSFLFSLFSQLRLPITRRALRFERALET